MNRDPAYMISARACGWTTSRREILDNGTLRRYIEEFSVTGLTSNPTIFDEAIGNTGAYDDGIRDKARQANPAKRCSSSSRWKTCAAPPICSGRSSTPPMASTAGCRWKCRRCWPTTPRAASTRRSGSTAGRPAEPVRQDPGHAGRRSGDRGIDLRRRADQRHAAVLARAISRRGRGLSARHRTPHRRRARSAGRFGRLVVRQPLGQGGERQGAGRRCATGSASRSPGAPTAPIASCWHRRAGASSRRRRTTAAPALGQHRHQGSRRRRTRCTSKRWRRRTRSTPCPEKTLRAFADTAKFAASMAADGGDAEAVLARSRGGHRYRRAREPAAARRRAGVREVVEGAACSASPTRARHCLTPECAVRRSQ